MINGITPEQYADAVATLCSNSVSIRALAKDRVIPITQMVCCSNLYNIIEDDDDSSCGEPMFCGLRFMRVWESGSFNGIDDPDLGVDIEDMMDVYTPVHDTVLHQVEDIWDKISEDTIIDDIRRYPALMFMTSVEYAEGIEWELVKAYYRSEIYSKYHINIPGILICSGKGRPDADVELSMRLTRTGSKHCFAVVDQYLKRM